MSDREPPGDGEAGGSLAHRGPRNPFARGRSRSPRLLQTFFERSPDLLCVADERGHFVEVNGVWQDVLGWSVDALRGRRFEDLVHPDDRSSTAQEYDAVVRQGRPSVAFENRYLTRSGSYRWLRWNALAVPDEGIVVATARDITEERRRNQDLAALQRITEVVNAVSGPDELLAELLPLVGGTFGADAVRVLLLDGEGRSLVEGAAWGLPPSRDERIPLGVGFAGRVAAERRPRIVPQLAHVELASSVLIDAGIESVAGVPLVADDRLVGVLHVDWRARRDIDQRDLALLERVGEPIAEAIERARLGADLRRTVEQFRTLFDESPLAAWVEDAEGRIQQVNRALIGLLGFAAEDLIGRSSQVLVHPDDREPRGAGTSDGPTRHREQRFQRADGQIVWALCAESAIGPIGGADGTPVRLCIVQVQDITERKRNAELVDLFFESASDLLVLHDLRRGQERLSPSWQQVLGWPMERYLAEHILELVHPDDRGLPAAALDALLTGAEPAATSTVVRTRAADGSYHWLSWRLRLLRDLALVVGTGRDITDAKEAEGRLQRYVEQTQIVARIGRSFLDAEAELGETLASAARAVAEHYRGLCCVALASGPVFDLAAVADVDPASEEQVRAALARHPLPVDGSLSGQVMRTRTPVVHRVVPPELRQLVNPPFRGLYDEWLSRSVAFVPVAVGELSLGTVLTVPARNHRPLDEADTAFLSDLGDRIALGVHGRRLQAAQAESEAEFRSAFDNAPIGMTMIGLTPDHDERYLRVNDAFCRLTGYPEAQLLGMGPSELIHPDDRPAGRQALDRLLARRGRAGEWTHRYVRADGSVIWVLARAAIISQDGRPHHTISHVQDITPQKLAEAELERRALFDPVTGLANRHQLMERLQLATEQLGRGSPGLGLVYLDLDHFKEVNDSHGHDRGDEVLARVAERVQHSVRAVDVAARLAGDEFVVLCPEIGDVSDVVRVVERLQDRLSEPVEVGGRQHVIGASMGIAVARQRGVVGEELLAQADAAMYEAKQRGRHRWVVFTRALQEQAERRVAVERDLVRALREGGFVLHYQPVVDLLTGGTRAVEARLRLAHPERGLLPAAAFLPVAENNDLVVEIGSWVLDAACRQAALWQARFGLARLEVRLARRHVARGDLVPAVIETVRATDVDPDVVALGVPEAAVVDCPDTVLASLAQLTAAGLHVSLDHFADRVGGLTSLTRSPVDTVKVPCEAVLPPVAATTAATTTGVSGERHGEPVAAALAALARALDLTLVAERVDTADQLAALRRFGWRYGQGAQLHGTQPPERIAELLAASAP